MSIGALRATFTLARYAPQARPVKHAGEGAERSQAGEGAGSFAWQRAISGPCARWRGRDPSLRQPSLRMTKDLGATFAVHFPHPSFAPSVN
jgi:hypothetical protein